MTTVHTFHIDERLPACVFEPSRSVGEGHALCELTARRFMGVLVRPVPPQEMEERAGTFRPGGKILVDWPQDKNGWYSVKAGDQLEVVGRTLTIRATRDYPYCYGEIYVDEA